MSIFQYYHLESVQYFKELKRTQLNISHFKISHKTTSEPHEFYKIIIYGNQYRFAPRAFKFFKHTCNRYCRSFNTKDSNSKDVTWVPFSLKDPFDKKRFRYAMLLLSNNKVKMRVLQGLLSIL